MRAGQPDVDGKNVFPSGRGIKTHLIVNAGSGKLATPDFTLADKAARFARSASSWKGRGFAVPIGERTFDKAPIGETGRRRGADGYSRRGKSCVATTSLAGCFGCHMSFLDIDERCLRFDRAHRFDRSPLTDIKSVGAATSASSRAACAMPKTSMCCAGSGKQCKVLIAIGACAINGGPVCAAQPPAATVTILAGSIAPPASRTVSSPTIPGTAAAAQQGAPDPRGGEGRYFIPGCPPSGDAIWKVLTDLLAGRRPSLSTA